MIYKTMEQMNEDEAVVFTKILKRLELYFENYRNE